jgi:hypothetical protein
MTETMKGYIADIDGSVANDEREQEIADLYLQSSEHATMMEKTSPFTLQDLAPPAAWPGGCFWLLPWMR